MAKQTGDRLASRRKKPRIRGRIRFFWFLLFFGFFFLFLVLLASSLVFTAYQRTPVVLDWSFERFLPGWEVELEGADWVGATELHLRGVSVRDRGSQTRVLSAEAIRLRFSLTDLWARKVEEIILVHPIIRLNTQVLESLQGLPAGPTERTGAPWVIKKISTDFGEFYFETEGELPLFLSSRFALDLVRFGTEEEVFDRMQKVILWGVSVSAEENYRNPFLTLDLINVGFSLRGLLVGRELAEVTISGGGFRAGAEINQLLAGREEKFAPDEDPADALPFRLGKLTIQDLRADLSARFPEVGPGIAFTLNTELANLPLGQIPDALGNETQLVELANIEILSPIDPLVRVISLHSVFVYFTLEGIFDYRLQRVIILSPTLYLSRDLFLYMESMKEGGGESTSPSTPWVIEQFRVEFGRLVLGGERIGQVGLPLSFQTTAENISLDNLAALQLETSLQVEPQDYEFPPLQIELEQLRGTLRFSFPPQDAPDNLVNTLFLEVLRWRQFTAGNLWMSATFDQTGIYADLGGEAYGGYVTAGISFSFDGQARWIGWVTGTGIDLASLTDILAPQNFRLTGPADFRVEVDAQASRIDRVLGSLHSDQPGTMTISKIDDLLQALPPDWNLLKQSGATIALETVRDFTYRSATMEFWFVEEQGKLSLRLPGEAGSRNLDLFLFTDETTDGIWKE